MIKKIENNEYISKKLYAENKGFLKNFDIDAHNQKALNLLYRKNKRYLDKMYSKIDKNIHIDREQANAILADEDRMLILAGAGTGKTTTIVSKIKYLIDIKKVDPSKIIVLSFTNKATKELKDRINHDFGLKKVMVSTFHSLGYKYIRNYLSKTAGKKTYVVGENERAKIFRKWFSEEIFPYKDKLEVIINNFEATKVCRNKSTFDNFFLENYKKINSFDEYLEYYKVCKLNEIENLEETVNTMISKNLNADIPISIKGEFMKSKGEALIANFLYRNGIDYEYEELYEELVDDDKPYRPDFTLHVAGCDIYVEYFGLSEYRKDKLNKYYNDRNKKLQHHRKYKTKFIGIDYKKGENILETLEKGLKKYNIVYNPVSYKDIYFRLLDNRPFTTIYQFYKFMYERINMIGTSNNRTKFKDMCQNAINKKDDNLKYQYQVQFNLIKSFYDYYRLQLCSPEVQGIDFNDMLYFSNLVLGNLNKEEINYDYVIIDEYQDVSLQKYNLTKNMSDMYDIKIVAVGDDWQSIFSFTGSKIDYIYNFNEYFPNSKIFKITETYRNSQQLINSSGKFIMKNRSQIEKELHSNKSAINPIKFIFFDDNYEYQKLEELLLKIHELKPESKVLVLGRTNDIIKRIFKETSLKDEVGTRISFVEFEDFDIDGMTIHKSKGLTYDETIIIGLDEKFPMKDRVDFWMDSIIKEKPELESIDYAEERRLFYVALTRTKNDVYLLVNKNPAKRSVFISEIYKIQNN